MIKKIIAALMFTVASVLLNSNAIYGAPRDSRPSLLDHMFFGGLELSFNSRQGSLVLTKQQIQKVNSQDLYTIGITAGKRFPLPANLRLSIPLSLDIGSQTLDTLYGVILTDGRMVDCIKAGKYHHVGITPVVQLPFKISVRANLFLAAGGGVHVMKFAEIMHQIGNSFAMVSSDYLESGLAFSMSADAGVGYEYMLSKRYGIAFQYNFRYWKPVKYLTSRGDLFLYSPVMYRETFLTHSIQVLILGI